MKRLIYILVLICFFACNSENAGDCFQTSGTIIQQEYALDDFEKVLVNRDIELIVRQGQTQKVVIETGKNLINDVKAEVVDGQLRLTDGNTCNLARAYGVTKVYITSANITQIRSATQYDVRSEGTLNYPSLAIFSEDFNGEAEVNSGNFDLTVNCNRFSLVFNNLSNAKISGNAEDLSITLAAGLSRVDCGALVAKNISVWNRSSNDIIVNPQLKLSGQILGTGDVISLNKPPQVDIEEVYKGRLIFK
ncbi:head GIN domain-containing protein [Cognatitamlana onchidii]|uniref:head GIN domain-containing protein n=1 Tax=Cognatitamlana onchidii TaxID=2562860 RepID=UPI0010A5AE56|nr:head GIN domain-containing protein [Algibacter onchidii]